MAQVTTDVQCGSSQKRSVYDGGLIEIGEWLKEKEGGEAQAGVEGRTGQPARKKAKGATDKVEANTIVTGRPGSGNPIDNSSPQSPTLPPQQVEVDLGGKNWVGQLLGMCTSLSRGSLPY